MLSFSQINVDYENHFAVYHTREGKMVYSQSTFSKQLGKAIA